MYKDRKDLIMELLIQSEALETLKLRDKDVFYNALDEVLDDPKFIDRYKKNQSKGLAFLKFHDKLDELNIEHEFIDKYEKMKKVKLLYNLADILKELYPFNYEIIIKENENRISLEPYDEKLIKLNNEFITNWEVVLKLIKNKNLNSYMIACDDGIIGDPEKMRNLDSTISKLLQDKKARTEEG